MEQLDMVSTDVRSLVKQLKDAAGRIARAHPRLRKAEQKVADIHAEIRRDQMMVRTIQREIETQHALFRAELKERTDHGSADNELPA